MSKQRRFHVLGSCVRTFDFLVTREYTEKASVRALNKTQALDMLMLVLEGKAESITNERVDFNDHGDPYGGILSIHPIKDE